MELELAHYAGREQAFIKHSLLRGYFSALIHKIASRYGEVVYVDGFSGPWGNADEGFSDTSFGIALAEMRSAKATWAKMGRNVKMRALLVEKRRTAYQSLEKVPERYPDIDVQTFNGEFVSLVPNLLAKIPREAFSFLFIDPKGWRIDMRAIAPLIGREHCEVLFNFMFEFINRAASMSEPATVQGVDELITAEAWRSRLAAAAPTPDRTLADARKEILVEAFSETLRELGGYEFVAETPIFRPMRDRTLYSLIYATRKPPGIVEFRRVQIDALKVQEKVRSTMRSAKTFGHQSELFGQSEMGRTETEIYLEAERLKAGAMLIDLAPSRPDGTSYADVWPRVMARHAVSKPELNRLAAAHRKKGRLVFPDWQLGRKVPSEEGRLARSL